MFLFLSFMWSNCFFKVFNCFFFFFKSVSWCICRICCWCCIFNSCCGLLNVIVGFWILLFVSICVWNVLLGVWFVDCVIFWINWGILVGFCGMFLIICSCGLWVRICGDIVVDKFCKFRFGKVDVIRMGGMWELVWIFGIELFLNGFSLIECDVIIFNSFGVLVEIVGSILIEEIWFLLIVNVFIGMLDWGVDIELVLRGIDIFIICGWLVVLDIKLVELLEVYVILVFFVDWVRLIRLEVFINIDGVLNEVFWFICGLIGFLVFCVFGSLRIFWFWNSWLLFVFIRMFWLMEFMLFGFVKCNCGGKFLLNELVVFFDDIKGFMCIDFFLLIICVFSMGGLGGRSLVKVMLFIMMVVFLLLLIIIGLLIVGLFVKEFCWNVFLLFGRFVFCSVGLKLLVLVVEFIFLGEVWDVSIGELVKFWLEVRLLNCWGGCIILNWVCVILFVCWGIFFRICMLLIFECCILLVKIFWLLFIRVLVFVNEFVFCLKFLVFDWNVF